MRLLLVLFLICCSTGNVQGQATNSSELEALSERLEDLEDELRRTSDDLEDEIGDQISQVRRESDNIRDDLNSAEADLKWLYTGAAFILGVFGVFGISIWGVFRRGIKRVEEHVKQIELDLNQKVERRAKELEDLFKKELESLVAAKKSTIEAMLNEGDLLYQALKQGSVLVLCRDEHDKTHMEELMHTWEFPNVTYTPLDQKADGTFDLVILDDHDKENIPEEVLKQCFANYPDAYFLFYVNNQIERNLIPEGLRHNFANSHVTLRNHALNVLKEIHREKHRT